MALMSAAILYVGCRILLAFIEVFFQAVLPADTLIYRDPSALVILIGVLLFRPRGLIAFRSQPVR